MMSRKKRPKVISQSDAVHDVLPRRQKIYAMG